MAYDECPICGEHALWPDYETRMAVCNNCDLVFEMEYDQESKEYYIKDEWSAVAFDSYGNEHPMGHIRCPWCRSELLLNYRYNIAECNGCGSSYKLFWNDAEQDWDIEVEYSDKDTDEMPECCIACGGPYPDCMTSCKIFDD